jgi:hypothetical protein
MASANRTKAVSNLRVLPSSLSVSSTNEESDKDYNHQWVVWYLLQYRIAIICRSRNKGWLPPIGCTCLSSFFGGLVLIVLLSMSILIPIMITRSMSAAETSPTSRISMTTASSKFISWDTFNLSVFITIFRTHIWDSQKLICIDC